MSVYVLNVLTGQESEIAQRVIDANHPKVKNVFNPLSVFQAPVFPGYIFVEMQFESDAYYKLLDIPGVFAFLSPYEKLPISEDEEENIRNIPVSPFYNKKVKVVRGKFEGIEGRVKNINYPYAELYVRTFEHETTIKTRVNNIVEVEHEEQEQIMPGQRVRITEGKLKGLMGTIKNTAAGEKVNIEIYIFKEKAEIQANQESLEVVL